MQTNFSKITFLVGNCDILEQIRSVPALSTFSQISVDFLNSLSRALLSDSRAKKKADIVSYAYWIRRASIEAAKESCPSYTSRVGRGVAFHVAPSNVPVNFAVSMTSSILAGNACIIRVSNKQFEQTDIICEAIKQVLSEEYKQLKPYFCIIRYDHDKDITDRLSKLCDVRVIWGGDNTISEVRKSSFPPRSIEMTFADRHSLAVINADEYLKKDLVEVAKGFYTDTYYTDQNACSSPRLVVWIGEKIEEARERFWNSLYDIVKNQYEMQAVQSVDKLTSFSELSMKHNVRLLSKDNLMMRIEVDELFPELMDYKNGGGYFFEYIADNLREIVPILDKKCQTVSVLGIDKDKINKLVRENGVRGVDRIVELGQTMGLEFIWDGFHMIEAMSRIVYVNY